MVPAKMFIDDFGRRALCSVWVPVGLSGSVMLTRNVEISYPVTFKELIL